MFLGRVALEFHEQEASILSFLCALWLRAEGSPRKTQCAIDTLSYYLGYWNSNSPNRSAAIVAPGACARVIACQLRERLGP